MKWALFLSILCVSLVMPAYVVAEEGQNDQNIILSVGLGKFSPRGDIQDFEQSSQFTISGLMLFGKYYGAGVDLGYHSTKLTGALAGFSTENNLETKSVEGLFYIQPNESNVQPYAAIGIGGYNNQMTFKWNGATLFDDSGTSFGWVLKVGLRVFVGDHLMLGVFAKYFSTRQDIKYATCCGSCYTTTSDIGGIIGSLDIGARF
ncbi:MAG: porin family protein [Syntrophales bacterium]